MATVAQLGVNVQSFQWTGQAFSTLPVWAQQLSLHNNGSGVLCVPSRSGRGTGAANLTDWVVQRPDGTTETMSNTSYLTLY